MPEYARKTVRLRRTGGSKAEFALFLDFLGKDALAHPEQLGNLLDLTADFDELLQDVQPDD